MALHCPECGFVNPEGANYCQKCGALLDVEATGDPTTATYRVGETGDFIPVDVDEVATNTAALVIRAGGGRAGESFPVDGERMTAGNAGLRGRLKHERSQTPQFALQQLSGRRPGQWLTSKDVTTWNLVACQLTSAMRV